MNHLDVPDRLRTAPARVNGGRILARTYAAAEAAGRAAFAGWLDAHGAVTADGLKRLTDAVARAAVDAAAPDIAEQAAGPPRAVLADRERELLRLKGPCRVAGCRSHYAHSGPCNIEDGFVSDVPAGEVGSEWAVAYKLDGEEREPGHGGQVFSSREEAKQHIEAWQRIFPGQSYTDVRYLRRTVLTGPWVTP